jgi:hypothetical protein
MAWLVMFKKLAASPVNIFGSMVFLITQVVIGLLILFYFKPWQKASKG